MEQPIKISCAVCQDLAPLVRDGVASADSEALVQMHLEQCETCRSLVSDTAAADAADVVMPDDANVIQRLRRRMSLWLLGLIAGGLALGMALMLTPRSYLIILFFPLLCGVVCWLDNFAWKLVPPLSALASIAVTLLYQSRYTEFPYAVISALRGCITPFVLCLIGALAAKLLKFGFAKNKEEIDHETSNKA